MQIVERCIHCVEQNCPCIANVIGAQGRVTRCIKCEIDDVSCKDRHRKGPGRPRFPYSDHDLLHPSKWERASEDVNIARKEQFHSHDVRA